MRRQSRGLSLLEIMIVVVLLAFLAATIFRGDATRPDSVEVAALADTLAAEFRSAAQRAKTEGVPVALVIPSDTGSRPHSQSLYRAEGFQPRIVDVRNFSGDFKRSCLAAGLVYPAGLSTITQPSDGGNGSTFDFADWVGASAIANDYVICFTPTGSVVTNDLPVVDGHFKLLVAYGISYTAASAPPGTGWGVAPSYYRIDEVGAGKILSISPSGQVSVEPLDPNTGIALSPQRDFAQTPATAPPMSVAGANDPNVLDLQIFPVPIPAELPPGAEAVVDINRHLSLKVVAEDSDAETRLECRWESDLGGAVSKPDWHPMTWDPDGDGPGLGAWVSSIDWKPPPGTSAGTQFVLTATVRDPNGATDSAQFGATGTIEAVDRSLIAFSSNRDGGYAIYGMMPDGSDVHRISDLNGGGEARLTYSGDRIMFRGVGGLSIQQVEGGGQPTLLYPGYSETGTFTTDGTRVFFSTIFQGWTATLNGNGPISPHDLTSDPGYRGQYNSALTPAISADNLKLAYTTFVGFNQAIVIADFDEMGPPFLNNFSTSEVAYSGGPDGDRQAWSPVMEPGSPPRRKLYFQANAGGGNFEIYSVVINYDTNQSFNNDPPVNLTNSPGRDRWPAVSPDGSQIAFDSERTGNWEIFRMDADGSNQVNISNSPADEVKPTWSN